MFQVPEVSYEEAKRMLEEDSNVVLLDVRTPQEYAQLRIPNSKLIPLDELRYAYKDLPKDKKYIVYCRSGERSAFATYFLRHMGYEAYNLAGGILTWPYEKVSGID
ncbi:MAG: rhodanese-like domain-containing protein [Hydrogenobacter thermophilus]|uniref:rhodanese-like domain-containing protein n=1 Tax=Hydrogenobacter thermophilus TaxID=940 RepID=UPI001C77DD13|nr:rhodanese-like domain-containing protein [Hydrogenobacter thermophilus]QWK19101.1 MAG: rhodanese-like domain-containing protein [Hydrogenobacter thermophilus]